LEFQHPQLLMMPNHLVVCYLLPFIHRILGFSHSIHPQKKTWHYFNVTCVTIPSE
jgi:hypothetical protein